MPTYDLLEFVNPPKLCVALWLREHVLAIRNFNGHRDMIDMDESGSAEREMTPRQRKNVCKLALKLIQECDMSMSELIQILKNNNGTDSDLPPFLYKSWKKHLVMLMTDGGAHGLMDLMECLEKLIPEGPITTYVSRSSIVGLFLRKLLLGFSRLGFSDVANLFQNFTKYFNEGLSILQEADEDLVTDPEIDLSSFSANVVSINKNMDNAKTTKIPEPKHVENFDDSPEAENGESKLPPLTVKQSELYISRQVDLLTTAEIFADSPAKIEANIRRILHHNPNLTEAHFLSYLNCLRVNEYTGAVEHLHNCLKAESEVKATSGKVPDLLDDNLSQGFRYSALNLAALHARFGQVSEAKLALREAVMLAQVAEDHVCLQHVLSWLYRLKASNEKTLIERCIAKSREHKLSYLSSLGIQSLAFSVGENGGLPSDVMNLLTQSEVLNCQHSLTELISSGFSLKSAFWSLYGRSNLSCVTSQLLLLLDTTSSGRLRKGHFRIAEDTILALANVARQMNDRGKMKEADKVLNFARTLCPNENSRWTSSLSKTQIQINFERCLHQTDWIQAERWISRATADPEDPLEPLLMQWQLAICQGDSEAAAKLGEKVRSKSHLKSSVSQVRALILEAELACLNNDFPYAAIPLTTAIKLCLDYNLTFLHALTTMLIAHVQLQFGLPHRALELLRGSLPTLMSHGSLYEMSRARLLLAKCLVATSPKDGSSKSRKTLSEAISILKTSLTGFTTMQAYAKAKDVVYLMALVYHSMDFVAERNQTAAEFKKMNLDHRTNKMCHLANIM